MSSSSNWVEVLDRVQSTLSRLAGKTREELVAATLLALYKVIPQILLQRSVRAAKWAVEEVLAVNPSLNPQQVKQLLLSDPRWILLGLEHHVGEWSTKEVFDQLVTGNYQGLFALFGWLLSLVDQKMLSSVVTPGDLDVLIDESLLSMRDSQEKEELLEIYEFMKTQASHTYQRFLEIILALIKGKTFSLRR